MAGCSESESLHQSIKKLRHVAGAFLLLFCPRLIPGATILQETPWRRILTEMLQCFGAEVGTVEPVEFDGAADVADDGAEDVTSEASVALSRPVAPVPTTGFL